MKISVLGFEVADKESRTLVANVLVNGAQLFINLHYEFRVIKRKGEKDPINFEEGGPGAELPVKIKKLIRRSARAFIEKNGF